MSAHEKKKKKEIAFKVPVTPPKQSKECLGLG